MLLSSRLMKKVVLAFFGLAVVGLGMWLILLLLSVVWPAAVTYVVSILGLAALMIVHEAGHYFAARSSGLRVTKFSIGFGPTFFKVMPDAGFWTFAAFGDRIKFKLFPHDPEKHGPTVFQVAAIPFLAYVQIAGMNPLEEQDPNDKGSYANASLRARIVTIFAGPLSNYVFASIFFFIPLYASGVPAEATQIRIVPNEPAAVAGLQDGDQIVRIAGNDVTGDWDKLSSSIVPNANKALEIEVLRDGQPLTFEVTPREEVTKNEGAEDTKRAVIGVRYFGLRPAKNVGEVAIAALALPPELVKQNLKGIGQLIRGTGEAKLAGPKGMVDTMATRASLGWEEFMFILGQISTSLALFNLLPIPALDGGRLLFLGYEATTRRRPNPTVEAHIHAIGLLMMLGLMLYVTLANDFGLAGSK